MSDELIKRLRGWRGFHQANLSIEAADRIEQLTAGLADAEALIEAQAKDHASNNVRFAEAEHRAKTAEAERDRLRAAIETISYYNTVGYTDMALDAASAALKGETP